MEPERSRLYNSLVGVSIGKWNKIFKALFCNVTIFVNERSSKLISATDQYF